MEFAKCDHRTVQQDQNNSDMRFRQLVSDEVKHILETKYSFCTVTKVQYNEETNNNENVSNCIDDNEIILQDNGDIQTKLIKIIKEELKKREEELKKREEELKKEGCIDMKEIRLMVRAMLQNNTEMNCVS